MIKTESNALSDAWLPQRQASLAGWMTLKEKRMRNIGWRVG